MNQYWRRVRDGADRLGVNREAFKKWRQFRSVPSKWHRALVDVTVDDFEPLTWEELVNPPAEEK